MGTLGDGSDFIILRRSFTSRLVARGTPTLALVIQAEIVQVRRKEPERVRSKRRGCTHAPLHAKREQP
jgi:hypothetical protein